MRDLVTDDVLPVLDDSIGAEAVGVAMVGRLTPVGDSQYVFASGTTPLDEAGLAVAAGFVRPGGRGLLRLEPGLIRNLGAGDAQNFRVNL